LQRKPEVTEPIGKLALPIHIAIVGFRELASIKTVAHHYGIGRLAYSFEEQRQVGWRVLTVCIDGNGMRIAHVLRLFECAKQSCTLAAVAWVGNNA